MDATGSDSPSVRLSDEEAKGLLESVRIIALRKLSDPHLAEDVAQETLVRTIEALSEGRLEDGLHLAAYVRAIAHHIIVDHYRSSPGNRGLGSASPLEMSGDSGNPLRDLLTAEERGRVRDALAYLSKRDREILRLCYYEGLSPKEIAARNGEPAQRIWKRKSRALERLRAAHRSLESGGQDTGDSSTHGREG